MSARWSPVIVAAVLGACDPSPPPPAHPQVAVIGPNLIVPPPIVPIVPMPPPPSSPSLSWPSPQPDRDPVEPHDLNQPPEVKLKLGHFRNARLNIGAVVDLTGDNAKLRFDGSEEIVQLFGEPGPHGRTDYMINGSRVVMQMWTSGRVVVYVGGSDEPIALYRDGDAEPL